MREITEFSQSVKNAFGELVIYALSTGRNVDEGIYLEMGKVTVGSPETGIKMGDWKITVQRTEKP